MDLQAIGVSETFLPYVKVFLALFVAGPLGYAAGSLFLWSLKKTALSRKSVLLSSIGKNLGTPIRFLFAAIAVFLGLWFLSPATPVLSALSRVTIIATYGIAAWLIVQVVEVFGDILLKRYAYEGLTDNLYQRKVYTQLLYIKRVVSVVVFILALAFVLMQFDGVRRIGTGLLTSAGVAGIVIGFAAQKSLANLLAGFQIAFTQPIRIDDLVSYAGEFARVEEITLTYVVLKIWDNRRMIVPLGKFIDEHFQNWTRTTTDITGIVLFHLDYSADLKKIRQKVDEIVVGNPLWNGATKDVVVTEVTEHTMVVRATMSAANAGDAFNLRCQVREGIITFLQQTHPEALPHKRISISSVNSHSKPNT